MSIEPIGAPEPNLPGNRMNDAKADAQGRIWAGTMDDAEVQESGSLYRFDPDLRWHSVDSGYRITNGPALSADGKTLYHTDSGKRISTFFPWPPTALCMTSVGSLGLTIPRVIPTA